MTGCGGRYIGDLSRKKNPAVSSRYEVPHSLARRAGSRLNYKKIFPTSRTFCIDMQFLFCRYKCEARPENNAKEISRDRNVDL